MNISLPVDKQDTVFLEISSSTNIDVSSIPYDRWQILINLLVSSQSSITFSVGNKSEMLSRGVYLVAIRKEGESISLSVYVIVSLPSGSTGETGRLTCREASFESGGIARSIFTSLELFPRLNLDNLTEYTLTLINTLTQEKLSVSFPQTIVVEIKDMVFQVLRGDRRITVDDIRSLIFDTYISIFGCLRE